MSRSNGQEEEVLEGEQRQSRDTLRMCDHVIYLFSK